MAHLCVAHRSQSIPVCARLCQLFMDSSAIRWQHQYPAVPEFGTRVLVPQSIVVWWYSFKKRKCLSGNSIAKKRPDKSVCLVVVQFINKQQNNNVRQAERILLFFVVGLVRLSLLMVLVGGYTIAAAAAAAANDPTHQRWRFAFSCGNFWPINYRFHSVSMFSEILFFVISVLFLYLYLPFTLLTHTLSICV